MRASIYTNAKDLKLKYHRTFKNWKDCYKFLVPALNNKCSIISLLKMIPGIFICKLQISSNSKKRRFSWISANNAFRLVPDYSLIIQYLWYYLQYKFHENPIDSFLDITDTDRHDEYVFLKYAFIRSVIK